MKRSLSCCLRQTTTKRKIAVALSGGVDSSVAAYLLQQQHRSQEGHEGEVIGVHMSNWDFSNEDNPDEKLGGKCWEQDYKDAQAVARQLSIPLHHVSFQQEYWTQVFEPYCSQLSQDIMPNPDVDCNRHVKFGALKDYVRSKLDCHVLATGHYARLWDPTSILADIIQMPPVLQEVLDQDPGLHDHLSREQPTLLAAADPTKDQSYFLSSVDPKQLSNVLFPLGDIPNKQRTRDIAKKADLATASKPDSMGICFIGKRKFGDFVHEYLEPPSANVQGECISVEDGSLVGTFDPSTSPLQYATVGQGAKLSGASQKWFVVNKEQSRLILCPGTHHPALYSDSLHLSTIHWMVPSLQLKTTRIRAKCRIRHLQPLVDCEIHRCDDDDEGHGYKVVFDKPLRGIAPGQVCVFYLGNGLICLGGGAIVRRGPSYYELGKDLPSDTLHPAGLNDTSILLPESPSRQMQKKESGISPKVQVV